MARDSARASLSSYQEDQGGLPPPTRQSRGQQQQPQSPPGLTLLHRPRRTKALTAATATLAVVMMSCWCCGSDSSFAAVGVRARRQQQQLLASGPSTSRPASEDFISTSKRASTSRYRYINIEPGDTATSNQGFAPSSPSSVEARQRGLVSSKRADDDGGGSGSSRENNNVNGVLGNDDTKKKKESENNNVNGILGNDDTKKKKDSDKQNHESENEIRKKVNQKLREKALKDNLTRDKEKQQQQKDKKKKNQLQTTQQKKEKNEKDDANKKKDKKEQSPTEGKKDNGDKKKKKNQKDKKNKKDDDADKKNPYKQSANLPIVPNKGEKDQNKKGKNDDKGKSKNDDKKPSKKNDDVSDNDKIQQGDSKHKGDGDKPSKKDDNAATSSGTSIVPNSGSPPPPQQESTAGGRKQWKFVKALSENSIPLDSFEDDDNTSFDLMEWTSTSSNPWSPSSQYAQDGKYSMVSGITSRIMYGQEKNSGGALPVYSNLTLSTESNFNGGVLTFRLFAKSLALPRESFFVTVDGNVELPPEDVIPTSSSSTLAANTWKEYSVPVGRGTHKITWVHVYNPFGLKVLPSVGGEDDNVGLWMDDLRLVPFTSLVNLDQLELTNGGGVDDATSWKVAKDGGAIVASSSDIRGSVGRADIQFALYSEKGAMLTYRVQTSTSGPHDDFAILFNDNAVVATTLFGDMIAYESRSLSIPKGKMVVTLSHRKNPGRLDRTLLQSLGEVGTEGRTWLESLSLNLN